jgi:putative transposase
MPMASIIRVSRSALLESTGQFFHIYNRGVNRQLVFSERDDYLVFIDLIQKWLHPDDLRMHTFQLMPNHFHFILQQLVPSAMSWFQKRITQGLAQWVNRHARRVGHLFQGRYKLKLVDDTSYLLHLSKYIHQNPVAAGLVHTAEEWEFGSTLDFLGQNRFSFLTKTRLLEMAGGEARLAEFLRSRTTVGCEGLERYLIEKPMG